jgi:hypothetical protein
MLEDKLISTRIIWYGHILRMNEENPEEGSKQGIKRKMPIGRPR